MYKFDVYQYLIIMTMENQERDAAIQQINSCKAGFRAAKTRQ